jgi:amino-acid N-acetyltransferase
MPVMALQAEPARPHDLRDALELLGRADLTGQDVAEGWGHYFVVREDDGRVVAVAGLEVHGEDGLLRSVAVDPAYRGQGLAGRLVDAVLERAALLKLRDLYLLTTTAAAYFARHGFAECGRDAAPGAVAGSWEFRSGCPATAVFMKRPVG